jgi:hypothetical protein
VNFGIDLETTRAGGSGTRLHGGRRAVRVREHEMERVDRARLPLHCHLRDRRIRDLDRDRGDRLETTARGRSKAQRLAGHGAVDANRGVRVPDEPINRQSNEGAGGWLARLGRESRLRRRHSDRGDEGNGVNHDPSLRSPLVVSTTFVRSHFRKIHRELAASATRRNDSGTNTRWT